ncbi:ABC transporter substrate-binding protein [Cribrihabitans pelagius]|uniref:ABC transporter substrate-binding protein n=1 Tax=Cribrihabitans pelagius TaxID=1765746 RepID=UPI003B5A26B1
MPRIDRRALFTSGAAAALLAAAGGPVGAGARMGGVLRLAVPREGALLEQTARGALHATLTEVAPDGVLRGDLAQGWQCDSDGTRWTFDLRSDVRFHDGRVLTAEDAALSLKALGVPGAGLRGAGALGPHRLALELDAPNPHLPYLLAAPGLGIAPSGAVDVPLAGTIGAGCYRVERAQEGRHFRAARVEGHYKSGSAGWVDAVEIIVIPDAAVRAEALRDGYVDIAALPEPRGLLQRGRFHYHPSAGEMALAARQDVGIPRKIGRQAPLDDFRIAERWWRI